MKKTVLKLGLCALLATNLFIIGETISGETNLVFAAGSTATEAQKDVQKVKGKITNISQKAKTIALTKKDKSFFLVKFNDTTELKGVESSKEFKVGEAIIVNYKNSNGEHIATSLEKALVKLPAGLKEIKTKELANLIAKDQDVVIVDARPGIKYAEGHIPGSISVPYSKLVKMGDDGAKLLAKYMDKQLVFYCGGST
ncbi:MAG: rhodanese-like domain-containing protein [Desulforhopalus sp.]